MFSMNSSTIPKARSLRSAAHRVSTNSLKTRKGRDVLALIPRTIRKRLTSATVACSGTPADIAAVYSEVYAEGLVRYRADMSECSMLCGAAFAGRDDMEVGVLGNDERILLVSRFDNLGKGASGAAIQNMNILLGVKEDTGLVIGE